MKVKTSELSDKALDFCVAGAEGWRHEADANRPQDRWLWRPYGANGANETAWLSERQYSTDWAQGGPIIERERIGVCHYNEEDGWEVPNWAAWRTDIDDRQQIMGESALIAAMRCYVRIKLGDEVEVPEDLL